MSHSYQLIKGVLAKLTLSSGLTAQLATYEGDPAVFAHVPQDMNEHPYICLFDSEVSPSDTDSSLEFNGTFTIHSWSDQSDAGIIANIQKSIYDALHYQDLDLDGYSVGGMRQDLETILKDVDGISYRGVQRFMITLKTNT